MEPFQRFRFEAVETAHQTIGLSLVTSLKRGANETSSAVGSRRLAAPRLSDRVPATNSNYGDRRPVET